MKKLLICFFLFIYIFNVTTFASETNINEFLNDIKVSAEGGSTTVVTENAQVGSVEMKKCPNCGTEVPSDTKFCTNCGKEV